MSEVKIVPAKVEDVPHILNFIRQLAEYEKMSDQVTATEEILRKNLFGAKPSAEAVLAELDGRKIGFAIFFTSFSTFKGKPCMYLEDLFVLPEIRGKGAGKKLLAHLAKLAVERDCARLDWSVLDWNTPAIEFYDSIGAKQLSDWIVCRLTGEPLERLAGSVS